jgi:hypothetical protein
MRIRRIPAPVVVPDGLPVLEAGVHLAPQDGVCLMEYVSVLAGEHFTDQPRCTDPTLAFLARLVNDTAGDDGRSLLAPTAADLSVLGRADAVVSARMVAAVVRRVQTWVPSSRRLGRADHRAERRLQRVTRPGGLGRLARGRSPLDMRGGGRHQLATAVWAVADAPWPDETGRDLAMLELLQLAMAVVREGRPQKLDVRSGHSTEAFRE